MNESPIRVGVIGAGTVGGGTIEILRTRADLLERRAGVRLELAAVAELDRGRAIAAGAPAECIVDDFAKVTENPEIDVVVELIGGTGIAERVVQSALEHGKAVVTANKALLSEKGAPLFALSREKQAPLAFEAAVAGGIPIILALREGLVCNRYLNILGIVNGTCNYILSEMIEKGVAYEDCLREAQALGYAEADPTTDVGGFDSGHKLALLSALAFETPVDFSALPIQGIDGMDLKDVAYARSLGYTIKLLAVARPEGDSLFLSVHPALLPLDHPLANVQGSMNAVALEGDVVMESMMYGRGAGKLPTASAVVGDIVAVARALRTDVRTALWTPEETAAYTLASFDEYRTRYYLRLQVEDRAGVMGQLTTALGARGVSLASVHQHEPEKGAAGSVPVVMLTHEAREGDVRAALAEIESMACSTATPVLYRIEG